MTNKKQVSAVLESLFAYKKVDEKAQEAIIKFSQEGWQHRQNAKSLTATLFDTGMRASMFKANDDSYDVDMVTEVRELIARGMPQVYFKACTMAIGLLPSLDEQGPDKVKRGYGMTHIKTELAVITASLKLFEDQETAANAAKAQDEYVEVVLYAMLDALIGFISGTKEEQWPNGHQPKVMGLASELNETIHALVGKRRAPRTAKYKK